MLKEPTYRQAAQHAWHMMWEHKLLWPLGLFATFLGQMGLVEFVSKFATVLQEKNSYQSWGNFPAIFASAGSALASINLSTDKWIWATWIWIILIGIFFVFLFVAIVSQAALVHATSQKLLLQKHPDIAQAWHAGVGHFWRLLAVHAIRRTLIFLLMIFIGMATIAAVNQTSTVSSLALVVMLCVSLALGFILSCLSIYTIGYVVVEELSLLSSLKSAWILFKEHLLVSLEVGFIVFIGNIVVVALALVGIAILLSPIILSWLFSGLFVSGTLWFLIGLSGFFFCLLYIVALGSFFTIWSTSLFTYIFMKMHKHGVESRMVHHFVKFFRFKKV